MLLPDRTVNPATLTDFSSIGELKVTTRGRFRSTSVRPATSKLSTKRALGPPPPPPPPHPGRTTHVTTPAMRSWDQVRPLFMSTSSKVGWDETRAGQLKTPNLKSGSVEVNARHESRVAARAA